MVINGEPAPDNEINGKFVSNYMFLLGYMLLIYMGITWTLYTHRIEINAPFWQKNENKFGFGAILYYLCNRIWCERVEGAAIA